MNEVLARLLKRQEEQTNTKNLLLARRAAIVEVAKQDLREDLNEEEDVEFRSLTADIAACDTETEKLAERINELADEESRTADANRASRKAQLVAATISVGREARAYDKGNQRASYMKDLAMKWQGNATPEQEERLARHAAEVATEPEYRDLNRTDSTGGYFVPPIWLMDQYVALARAGRVTANLVNQQDLPAGTDSINIPKISSGTATAIQTADNAAVQETDLADATISAGVKTIAGQQDVSIQLLEQSPINFDQVIFADLTADLNTNVNLQVLSGSNGSGQVKGLRSATGVNTTSYTDTTPTVPELYSKIAGAVQQIHAGRFLPPTAIVMHPRRWAWFLASLDSQNRPLVVPVAQGPNNALGTFGGVHSEGYVGDIMGLPVYVDPSIPTTLGAATNEDTIVVMRSEDLILFESGIKTRVLPDVGSGTLTIRLQVYKYMAFTAERLPASITLITGTGLVSPSF
jgi:HK97 family phage major capsid protein